MKIYLLIGLIVGFVATMDGHREANKAGIKFEDLFPTWDIPVFVRVVCWFLLPTIVIAIMWPKQVFDWIKQFVSKLKSKKADLV